MPIPKEIIDNSEGNKLVTFLNDALKDNHGSSFDVASAFFNVQAYAMLKENLNGLKRFRLLLGKTPEIQSEKTLGQVLLEQIMQEIEGFELTRETTDTVKIFIEFLKRDNVEVRLFEQFLHGKAYILDNLIVIGSSNFTSAGLTRYGELNTWKQESQAIYTRKEWFEKFWAESIDFKEKLIGLLEDSRFGSKEYSPYEIYIKALYELQKQDIAEEEKDKKPKGLPETKVNLAQFQEDAIARIWTRLKKYHGCIVADSVGLGKTWIAKKVLEKIGYYERKNILVICPAQLREMWRRELKGIDVKENILSQEDIASEDFLAKAKRTLGGRFDNVELVVVDESHNFRNPLSNRWENLFTLLNDNVAKAGNRPYMLFLTATPINNTPWDLYWQIMLLVLMDRSKFAKENIGDLYKFFREAQNAPSMLNDLLNEISIRRTRDYIIKNYPDAYINIELPNGELREQKIIFPDRKLENVNYELNKSYKGMYKEISDTISDKLTMAYYRLLEYRKEGIKTEEEQLALGRMIAIEGIFRTILLKRLESSVEAFRKSINNHMKFLENLKSYLNQGKLLTKQSFLKYLMSMDEEVELEEVIESLQDIDLARYDKDDLFGDIDKDIALLKSIFKKVRDIRAEDDAKLKELKNMLLTLSRKGQIVLFTYYSDTLNYIYKEIKSDKRFSKIRIEAISSSGDTGKTPAQREIIVQEFFSKKVDVIMSTDVLSEGQNLQTAQYVINYDLHWNPTRMIQRAGRIDRIGSPYEQIYVYNFFPEDELEELLRLVAILQDKIIDIDSSIGLDQTILGEEIHPKVFGIIRRIHKKDAKILNQLEAEVFGGGERFYQPLKDYLKSQGTEALEKIPYGVFSGLKNRKASGIFFYFKYEDDFHFWYLYDVKSGTMLTNKSEIIDYISCQRKEQREIPDFFEKVYEANQEIVEDIERAYKEIELGQTQDSKLRELSKSRSSKFVKAMITEIELQLEEYLDEFPGDESIENFWELVKNKLIATPQTKRRLQDLRRMWRQYRKDANWKDLIKKLNEFLLEKWVVGKVEIAPFDRSKLKLVTLDFVS